MCIRDSVYAAPDSKSLRGAKGRARVSTNGWIQVFGSEGDWILVQYDITDTHNRIGYIEKDARPDGTVVPELNLTRMPAVCLLYTSSCPDGNAGILRQPLQRPGQLAHLRSGRFIPHAGADGRTDAGDDHQDGVHHHRPRYALSGRRQQPYAGDVYKRQL